MDRSFRYEQHCSWSLLCPIKFVTTIRYDEASTAANLRTSSDKHIYFHLNEYEYNELINAKENTQIKLQSLLAKIEWFHVTYLEEKDFDELYEPEDLRCKEANITAVSLINKAMKFLHLHEMNKQYLGRSRNENVMVQNFGFYQTQNHVN